MAVILSRPLFAYAARLTAAIGGRVLRKWWQRQPPERKRFITQHVVKNQWKYIGSSGLIGCTAYEAYRKNIFITPYTSRERFILNKHDEVMELSIAHFKETLREEQEKILPMNHPQVIAIRNIVQSIVSANKDIPRLFNKYWAVTVINSKVSNACVMQTGDIIVYNGMLDYTNNIHQVATFLAHEMSHVLLDHNIEKYSNEHLVESLMFVPILLLWAILPTDLLAAGYSIVFGASVHLFYELPYSRKLEEEADVVGLFLMASACYDVREASVFWGQLDVLNAAAKDRNLGVELEWLSTHPSYQNRQLLLDYFMEDAIVIRKLKKCPQLRKTDPRIFVEMVRENLPESRHKSVLRQLTIRNDFKKFDDTAKIFVELKAKR